MTDTPQSTNPANIASEHLKTVKPESKVILKDFLRSFLMPTFVGKTLVLYFGLMYSNYPDEGYGYGLIASIAFTVVSLILFAWKYKDVEDL